MLKVKVASSRWNDVREYETEATTWGELKSQLGVDVLNFEGSPMKAVLRSSDGTRNVLVENSTLLPSVDFALVLVPEKVKSGSVVYGAAKLKETKTIINKVLDFLIAGEEATLSTDKEWNSPDEPEEEVVLDPLVQEAIDIEDGVITL